MWDDKGAVGGRRSACDRAGCDWAAARKCGGSQLPAKRAATHERLGIFPNHWPSFKLLHPSIVARTPYENAKSCILHVRNA